MESYKTKRVTSGTVDEYIVFDKHIKLNHTNNKQGRGFITNLDNVTDDVQAMRVASRYLNRKCTINKNKSYLRRLMLANANKHVEYDKFVTLTFKKNSASITECDREFINFIKRLKRFAFNKFKYLAVREKQKRGAIHYHVIFYNLEYIPHKELLNIWNKNNALMGEKKSGVNIKKIEEGELIISAYMSKYFTKQLDEDDFLKGRKIILKSADLFQPIVEKLEHDIDYDNLENVVYACSFLDTKTSYIKINKNT